MPKVLILASYAPSLIDFRGDLIRAIVDRGHEVVACAPGIQPELAQKLLNMGARPCKVFMRRTETNPLTDLRTIWDFYRIIRVEKPDKVMAYTVKPILYGALACRLAGVTGFFALITGLGYSAAPSEAGSHWLARLIRLAYKNASKVCRLVFFQNADDRDYFVSSGLISDPRKALIVNGSGVNTEQFQPVPLPDGQVFLMIARILKAKGIREYIEAARLIRARDPRINVKLVGWFDTGPDAITPEEFAEWNWDGAVEFMGRLDDVRPAIGAASVYVLPSYREGMPRTVLEAMAMGRPVITTDVPGCRDTVTPGVNGYLVPANDPQAIAAAMLQFVQKPDLAESMGRVSRRFVEERYDVRKVNAVMIEAMSL
jgi:glycosyltransferase involved in cell wall biosynthesis